MSSTTPPTAEQELERLQIPTERLKKLSEEHRPPQEWYDGPEEKLFE